MSGTLKAAKSNLERIGRGPDEDDPAELVADKGYHSRDGLKDLEDSAWKSRISEPKPNGILRWRGDDDAERAYYNTAPARSPVSRVRPSSYVLSWSNARSLSPWIVVACAEPGSVARAFCKNGIWSISAATILA